MSGAPKWQAGHLYVPGDIVQPVQQAPAVATALPNASFEDGDTGWSKTGFTILNDPGGYSGDWFARFAYNAGVPGSIATTSRFPVTPGQSVSASCMMIAFGADQCGGDCNIVWLNSSGSVISTSQGGEVNNTHGASWRKSSVTGVAPAGAANAYVQADAFALQAGGVVGVDAFVWGYTAPASTAGLVYKAVQADAGTSGATEPEWPTTNGVTVIDNEVTWEAVQTSRVVWEASHILVSGGTEPTWPAQVGGYVRDGSINWEAISRRVEDENCPNSKVVAIIASKVFAADRDIARFSATLNPLDWTSEQDAGFLATGLQQANSNNMAVLNQYRGNLVAFNASCFQNWQADPDPAAMALLDQMDGVGSTWQQAATPVGNELFYLSQLGVRTIGIANAAENLAAGDVGSPIDPLVREALRVATANGSKVHSTYYPGAGQYWLAFPDYPPPPLSISGDLPDGGVGDVVAFEYTVSGGVLPIGAVTIASGALPEGLTMDAAGVVTGTVSKGGAYAWTVAVTDADGTVASLSDSATFTLTVMEAMVSFWPLTETEGTRYDASGPNHLTDVELIAADNVVTGVPGSGSAISLSSNSRLSRPAVDCVGLDDAEEYEIVCWINSGDYDSGGAAWQPVSKTEFDGAGYQVNVFSGSGTPIGLGAAHGGGDWPGTTKNPLAADTWVMVSAARHGGSRYVAFDAGAETLTEAAAAVTDTSAVPFRLGMVPGYGTNAAPSIIGQTAFFNRKLTQAEREYLYNGGAGRTYAQMLEDAG